MRTVLLATSNAGKGIEIRESLAGLPLRLMMLQYLPSVVPPSPEGEGTFAGNARQKALHYHRHTGMPTIADDSGILVEALAGELGVATRRWGAGPQASDEEWIAHFLQCMKQEKNKRASFVCVLAFAHEQGVEMFEGRCEGSITEDLEAGYLPGLPISACFKPEGCDKVFSALTVEEKKSAFGLFEKFSHFNLYIHSGRKI